jgi:hypothetical protein
MGRGGWKPDLRFGKVTYEGDAHASRPVRVRGPMQMTEAIIRAAFPDHPVPNIVAGSTGKFFQEVDDELSLRVNGRPWSSVLIMDWRYVGNPAHCREYMLPYVFAYYVPSFLVGALVEPEWLCWALEAVIPFNKYHEPRGEWWFSFVKALTDPQRGALQSFLIHQRHHFGSLDIIDEELLSVAEAIWAL